MASEASAVGSIAVHKMIVMAVIPLLVSSHPVSTGKLSKTLESAGCYVLVDSFGGHGSSFVEVGRQKGWDCLGMVLGPSSIKSIADWQCTDDLYGMDYSSLLNHFILQFACCACCFL